MVPQTRVVLHQVLEDLVEVEWGNLAQLAEGVQLKYQVCLHLFNLLDLVIQEELELQLREQLLAE